MPRAGLARRFGADLVRRLDQALGVEPEPITPAAAPLHFAVRLSLPEPIGLEDDILAGLDRLAPVLCDKLRAQGRGARRVRLEASRVDGDTQVLEVGLARPTDRPDQLRPLFALKTGGIDAGFGIDRLRLSAPLTEPCTPPSTRAAGPSAPRPPARAARIRRIADLIARIGARVGLEAITRARPADSHIPEKTATPLAAAWSERASTGRARPAPGPSRCSAPNRSAPGHDCPDVPASFTWRGRTLTPACPRPRTHRARMVARRSRLALRRARLLARDDRGWHDALALLCPWRHHLGGGWFAHGDFG
jgi:protein ImuB